MAAHTNRGGLTTQLRTEWKAANKQRRRNVWRLLTPFERNVVDEALEFIGPPSELAQTMRRTAPQVAAAISKAVMLLRGNVDSPQTSPKPRQGGVRRKSGVDSGNGKSGKTKPI